MAKPTKTPNWADNLEIDPLTSAENKVEPTAEFKLSGLKRGELLARAFVNYQFDLINQWIKHMSLRDTVYDMTGETDINPDNGHKQTLLLSANTTLTESLATGDEVDLIITSATFSITWPASVAWGNAGAPTLTSKDIINIKKVGNTAYATVTWSVT